MRNIAGKAEEPFAIYFNIVTCSPFQGKEPELGKYLLMILEKFVDGDFCPTASWFQGSLLDPDVSREIPRH